MLDAQQAQTADRYARVNARFMEMLTHAIHERLMMEMSTCLMPHFHHAHRSSTSSPTTPARPPYGMPTLFQPLFRDFIRTRVELLAFVRDIHGGLMITLISYFAIGEFATEFGLSMLLMPPAMALLMATLIRHFFADSSDASITCQMATTRCRCFRLGFLRYALADAASF